MYPDAGPSAGWGCDVEGGVGWDGGGGVVQLSSRKSRRCPAIFARVPPCQSALCLIFSDLASLSAAQPPDLCSA